MRKSLPFFLVGLSLWPGWSCRPANVSEKLAEIDGTVITRAEVDKSAGKQLQALRQQLYQLERQKLDEYIGATLVTRQAKERGISVSTLLEQEVNNTVQPVSEEEIRNMYEKNKERIGVEFDKVHAAVIEAAIDSFRSLGAREVIVAEGPGHRRDNEYLLTASGLYDVIKEHRVRYVDLNSDDVHLTKLKSSYTNLKELYLPETLYNADLLVSMPKLKTHHWAGVTLSLKNMAIQGHLQSLDDGETFADTDHLLEGRFDLILQQIDFLRRNALQLRLELIVESGNAIDLAEGLGLLRDVFVEP